MKLRSWTMPCGGTVYAAETPGREIRVVVPRGTRSKHAASYEDQLRDYVGLAPKARMY